MTEQRPSYYIMAIGFATCVAGILIPNQELNIFGAVILFFGVIGRAISFMRDNTA